jgi:hypothetical protein
VFEAFIDENTIITTPYSEIKDTLLQDSRWTHFSNLEHTYVEYQKAREARCRSLLSEALKENAFVKFHVKAAVQSSLVEAVGKSKNEAQAGDEWRFIHLEEIHQVLKVIITLSFFASTRIFFNMFLQEDKRYNDFECFATERERIVFAHVKALIEEFRKEKGGTRDNIIAVHAGGHKK